MSSELETFSCQLTAGAITQWKYSDAVDIGAQEEFVELLSVVRIRDTPEAKIGTYVEIASLFV
jgi:hypothetical protein